jgi:hypothetical protein
MQAKSVYCKCVARDIQHILSENSMENFVFGIISNKSLQQIKDFDFTKQKKQ